MTARAGGIVFGERYAGSRWTVLRMTTPGTRSGRTRARYLCRCSCGAEQAVFHEDLAGGRSGGCKSTECRARFEAVQAIRPKLDELFEGFMRDGLALRGFSGRSE